MAWKEFCKNLGNLLQRLYDQKQTTAEKNLVFLFYLVSSNRNSRSIASAT
jgi:hypothetical protein